MLWVDKHRPKSLDRLDYHESLSKRLSSIAQNGELPHLLFYGPSGAGKKTRIMALLREIFGPGVEKLRLDHRTLKGPSNQDIEISTLSSAYHIEMNPSDAGRYDRIVVQEIVKEIAQYHPVTGARNDLSQKSSSSSSNNDNLANKNQKGNFKVVLLSDADAISKEAQHALRRTMEKYMKVCRLILCCENVSKIIDPLKSRCLAIRVGAPTVSEISNVIASVAQIERVTLSPESIVSITSKCDRNLRRALLIAEAQQSANGTNTTADWEIEIKKISDNILKDQNANVLLSIRESFYKLLGTAIPATLIMEKLVENLVLGVDDQLRYEAMKWAAYYEARIQQGNKDIYHMEAFVARFMMIYKEYLIELFG